MHDINFLRSHNQNVTISSPFLSIYCSLHFLIERIFAFFSSVALFLNRTYPIMSFKKRQQIFKAEKTQRILYHTTFLFTTKSHILYVFFTFSLHTAHTKPSAIFFSLLPGISFVCVSHQPDCLTNLPCYIPRFLDFPFKKSYNMSKELYCNRKDRHGMSE